MTAAALILLGLAAVVGLAALVRGPTAADRMVALDLLLLILAGGIGVWAVETGQVSLLIIVAVVALVAFVGTVMVARIIEARGEVE